MRWMIVACAAVALLLACDAPRAGSCPGSTVARLQLTGTLEAGGCAFADDGGFNAPVTLAWDLDGSAAAVCPDRPEAQPLTGTHQGDHVAATGAPVPATPTGCSCPATVTEELEGDVVRDGGVATGFAGELRDRVTVAEGADAGPDGSCDCGLPCVARYGVTGSP